MYPENEARVLATLTSRLLAQLVDTAVALGLMFVLVFAVVFSASIVSSPGQTALALTVVLACIACMVYVLLSDGMPGGRSLGKRLLGIEVIHATTGRPCTYGQSLVRNLVLSFLGPIDCVCIFGGRQQRLGDRAAQTIVVNTLAREPTPTPTLATRRTTTGTIWTDVSPPLEPPVHTGSTGSVDTSNPLAVRPAAKTPSGKGDDWMPF